MIRTEQKEVYQIMVSGHLRERDGIYYMVLSYTDEDGKRHCIVWGIVIYCYCDSI